MKKKSSSSNINTKIQALGIYQILGGVYGLYLTLKLLTTLSQISNLSVLIFFIAIILYCYSIVCGVFIITKKDNEFKYSLLNQYLQLISFAILGYGFEYASGIYLYLGINFTDDIIFKAKAGFATWRIIFNTDSNEMQVYLNIIPILLITFIDKIRKIVTESSVSDEINQIST